MAISLGLYIFRTETVPSQQMYYRRGMDFARVGKYESAIRELNRALEYDPDFAPAYNNLGVIYSRLGRKREAIGALEKAVWLDPAFPEACYNLGKLYMELSVEDRALDHLREALMLDPDYDRAREAVAEVYFKVASEKYSEGKYNQADHNVSRAHDHNPERADILELWAKTELELKRFDKALELFREASGKDPDLDVAEGVSHAFEQKGEALYKESEFEDAGRFFASALEKNPENGRANYFLGLCYSRSGDIDRAIELLRKGLKLDDRITPSRDRAEYHLALAHGQRRSKNYEKAIVEYKLSQAIDPSVDMGKGFAECYFWVGRDQSERGRHDRAIHNLEKAVEREPGSVDYRLTLAKALNASKEHGRAVAEYRSLLEIEPGSAAIRVGLAEALMRVGLYEEAVSELERARRINPDLSLDNKLNEAYYGRGRIAERLGEFQKAIDDYTHVVEMATEYGGAQLGIGRCYEKMGDFRRAMEIYRKYIDDKSIGWQCHYRLGIYLAKTGDRKAAIEYAQDHLDRGDKLRDSDKFNEAMEEYRKASEIAPDWSAPHWVRAQTHYFRKEYKECIPYLEKSLEIETDNPIHLNDLAVIYAKVGRHVDAEALFHQAIKIKSPYYKACVNLSYLYGLMNKDKEALWWARKAGEVRKGFSQKGESGFWLR